ncbi:MAG: zinc metallopeptidase [Verrucomicrobiales bacterium]
MYYLLIAVIAGPVLISLFVRGRFQSVYDAARQVKGNADLTGAGVARQILEAAGIRDVEIVEHWGFIPDFYDPARKRLMLSRPHFRGSHAAAYGIAAHEAGHVLQDRANFAPLKMRITAIRMSQYLSPFIFLIPVVAILGRFTSVKMALLGMFLAWGALLAYNLSTVPVEFDSTERSKEIMARLKLFRNSEQRDATYRMMATAPLMYVSGFLNTLRWLLAYILPGNRG